MKKLTLAVLESTYEILSGIARSEGLDTSHFCSILLAEHAEKPKEIKRNEAVLAEPAVSEPTGLPDTALQVFGVCRYVWTDRLRFNDAVRKVASDFQVRSTTVRDKCTRRISLRGTPVNTHIFLNLLSCPEALRDHLVRKFPAHKTEIARHFDQLVARNGDSPVASVKPQPSKPEAEISEMELIREIVALLVERGGAAPKTVVEESLFQKFRDLFQTPYYSKLVGEQVGYAGIPRWQKNIQFARHNAKKMGLLKPPEESGRGIWELTEKGRHWKAE